jgi:hypothetical protein
MTIRRFAVRIQEVKGECFDRSGNHLPVAQTPRLLKKSRYAILKKAGIDQRIRIALPQASSVARARRKSIDLQKNLNDTCHIAARKGVSCGGSSDHLSG